MERSEADIDFHRAMFLQSDWQIHLNRFKMARFLFLPPQCIQKLTYKTTILLPKQKHYYWWTVSLLVSQKYSHD
jgi:hypothetical protein